MRKLHFIARPSAISTLGFFLTLAVGWCFFARAQRNLENQLFEQELRLYQNSLSMFVEQSWVTFAMGHKLFGNVLTELPAFIDKSTFCVAFSVNDVLVGRFGNCILHQETSFRPGWHSHGTTIYLEERYAKGIKMHLVRDNGLQFNVVNGSVTSDLTLKHFKATYLQICALVLLYILTAFLIVFVRSLLIYRERSADKIHDFGNIADDNLALSEQLELAAGNEAETLRIAKVQRCIATLRNATLSEVESSVVRREVINLPELIDELVCAYFSSHDTKPLSMTSIGNVSVVSDHRLLLRLLGNVLDNAFKHVVGWGSLTISTIQSPTSVDILISNDVMNFEPKKIFRRGFSGRGSTGRGLSIIENTARVLNLELYVTYSEKRVVFGITAPIHTEGKYA